MNSIIILGAGNVARHLYAAFLNQKSVKIIQCFNRKGVKLHKDQKAGTITSNLTHLKKADVYILAISDDAIEKVTNTLPFKDRLVVHTSGSVPMQSINDKNYRGVFYPLQSFSATKKVDFSEIPFCLEAERKTDLAFLKELASILSDKIYDVSSDQRNVLHVAAVFVNNFTNYMFSVGHEICEEHKVPFEILHPLIQETTKKILVMEPDKAQTGPALRKDIQTMKRHLEILTNNSQKQLYKSLTKAIQSKYGKEL